MENKKRLIGILAVIVIIIAIIGALFFWLKRKPAAKPVGSPNPSTQTPANLPPAATPAAQEENADTQEEQAPAPIRQETTSADLIRLAKAFAERFGSYSNQSNFNNITDLKIFMTEKMSEWADGKLIEMRKNKPAYEIYFGVTTKAVATELVSFDNNSGKSEVVVSTQRRESSGTKGNTRNYYQDINIKFVKEDNVWRVDSATWLTK